MFVYLKDILLGKIYKQKSNKWKYTISLCIPKLLLKKIYFFTLQYIRMSEKNIDFNDKKNQEKHLLQKQSNK